MDTGVLITAAIFVALTLLPFGWMYLKSQQKEKKKLEAIRQKARELQLEIALYEISGNCVFAMDHQNKTLFFSKATKAEIILQWVELSLISTCKVQKTASTHTHEGASLAGCGKIEMQCVPKNAQEKPIRFTIYDELTDINLTGEIQFAEKWQKLISSKLVQ